mgnify:FL=1
MLSYAHVVNTTEKQVISRRRKNENVCNILKNEKCTCKACKTSGLHCQICKFVTYLLPSSSWLLKLPIIKKAGIHLIRLSGTFRDVYERRARFSFCALWFFSFPKLRNQRTTPSFVNYIPDLNLCFNCFLFVFRPPGVLTWLYSSI